MYEHEWERKKAEGLGGLVDEKTADALNSIYEKLLPAFNDAEESFTTRFNQLTLDWEHRFGTRIPGGSLVVGFSWWEFLTSAKPPAVPQLGANEYIPIRAEHIGVESCRAHGLSVDDALFQIRQQAREDAAFVRLYRTREDALTAVDQTMDLLQRQIRI